MNDALDMPDVLELQLMENDTPDPTGELGLICSASSGSTAGCNYTI
jgi:hypothetical protein